MRKPFNSASVGVLIAVVLSIGSGATQAQALRMQAGAMQLASGTFGANGHGGQYQVFLDNVGEQTAVGPFTLSTRLPPGVSLSAARGFGWSCTTPVTEQVVCTFAGNLQPFQQFGPLTLWLDIAVGLAPPGGVVEFRSTVTSGQHPLPPVPSCQSGTSTSGCITTSAPVTQSSLRFLIAGADSDGFPVGGAGFLRLVPISQGFGINNTPVSVGFLLPEGLNYVGPGPFTQAWSCAAQGQRVNCSTPYLTPGQAAEMRLGIAVDADVPVGSVRSIVAWVGNPQQPAPTSAECLANPTQIGCALVHVTVAAPVVATPVIFTLTHPQVPLVPNRATMLFSTLGNIGTTPPSYVHVHVRLPSGLSFVTGGMSTHGTCLQNPRPDGIDLLCSTTSVGLFDYGHLQLQLLTLPSIRRPSVPVVLALDFGLLPSTQILNQCVSDARPAHCARIELPVIDYCGEVNLRGDGSFCGGFEPLQIF